MYFVHSDQLRPDDPGAVLAVCEYGGEVTAAVRQGPVFGVQFHPEKSQRAGLRLLRNFSELGIDDLQRGEEDRMLKNRLIPCILLRNGVIVQSKGFKRRGARHADRRRREAEAMGVGRADYYLDIRGAQEL